MSPHECPPRGAAEAIVAAILRFTLQKLLKPAFSPRVSSAAAGTGWRAGAWWRCFRASRASTGRHWTMPTSVPTPSAERARKRQRHDPWAPLVA